MDNPNAGTLPAQNSQQKTIIKAGITATLILLMLIPASFIMRLVEERQARQKEVVEEVSSKWASKQTITTPYINLPYTETYQDKGKVIVQHKYLNILANNLQTNDSVTTIERSRSIYNVLLYRSELNLSGDFKIKIPKDIPLENIQWNQARICIGISDFKGIEEKLVMNIDNSTKLDMQPGLPNDDISEKGLSALLPIAASNIDTPIGFSLKMNIKGSEQLHYIPLSANSRFTIRSNWNSPSFDGNSLPQEHQITATGFTATWGFNEANLPFTTVLNNKGIKDENIAFGVSLLQPTDQYAKTMRSVKYAILFIGLTFAIFFMVELMQNKVVHPVQYVLIGLALIIFYTLLLSIGEFTGFNIAYAIAASATILLVGIYSKSLFNSGKTSFWLSAFLLLLYGFIYVLIQLEDTALLAGSIGLFMLLAAAMYFSRRINWNGQRPSTILVP